MKLERHMQSFCSNGHFTFMLIHDDKHCRICKADIVLENIVELTATGKFSPGIILPEALESLLVTPTTYETCNLGHRHKTSENVYRVPSREELKSLQSYWDDTEEKYLPFPD